MLRFIKPSRGLSRQLIFRKFSTPASTAPSVKPPTPPSTTGYYSL